MTPKNIKIRVKSWKELEALGKPCLEGFLIPMGVYGIEGTTILFDEVDEFFHEEKKQLQGIKDAQGAMLLIGNF